MQCTLAFNDGNTNVRDVNPGPDKIIVSYIRVLGRQQQRSLAPVMNDFFNDYDGQCSATIVED